MENHLSMQKFKLIKEYEDYYLISDKEIESGDEYVKLDNRPRTVLLGTTAPSTKVPKLSKQNCDEIFGIIDVKKLAEQEFDRPYIVDMGTNITPAYQDGFKIGFKKAMELNKDKVFTLSDISYAISFSGKMKPSEIVRNLLLQPIEIEVEIEMEDSIGISDKYTPDNNPKLDSQGCLILTKKI